MNNLSERDEEIDLLKIVEVLIKNWVFIIKFTLYIAITSAIISLVIPAAYKSTAKILPPKNSSSSITSQIQSILPSAFPVVPLVSDTLSLYGELLKTNYVIDYVIEKNKLKELYNIDKTYKLREMVKDKIEIVSDKKSQIITIGYIDKNKELAYRVVKSLIEGLKELNDKIAITEASQRRLFYEKQLQIARENLIRSEEELRRFQLKTGTIKLDEEAKGIIEQISYLRAEITSKEVRLKSIESYLTKENPEYKNLVDEIKALKEQLEKLQSKVPSNDPDLFSTKQLSNYGIEYIRKVREFKYNEALYEILLKQYETARLDESRDPTIIQVIEDPEIPQVRVKPKRKFIVFTSIILSIFVSIIIVFLKTFYENNLNIRKMAEDIKNEMNYLKILNSIRDDMNRVICFLKTNWKR